VPHIAVRRRDYACGKFDLRLPTEEAAVIRLVLNDAQGERVAPRLPGKAGDPGRTAVDNRLFLEAVLWIARVGAPWRDLLDLLGAKGHIRRAFQAVIRGTKTSNMQ
jgi:hypothetical protein